MNKGDKNISISQLKREWNRNMKSIKTIKTNNSEPGYDSNTQNKPYRIGAQNPNYLS